MRAAGVDALVVTHLPNLRYLTGLCGSAGAAILDARALPAHRGLPVRGRSPRAAGLAPATGSILEIVDRGYDEAIVEVLQRTEVRRIGIEAA